MHDKGTIRRVTYTTRDKLHIVADVGGERGGPTVVLMHGGGQTRHSWSSAMRSLIATGYHVINFDALGHGESSWSPSGYYSLQSRARDLETVLEGVTGSLALVGASLGGATALCAVGERIEPAATVLIMVDIVPRIDPAGAEKIATFMRSHPGGFATLEEAADAVAAYNPHRPRPGNISGLRKNLRLRDDGRYHWHWDQRMLEGLGRQDADIYPDMLSGYAAKVDIPTLLVRGMASEIVTDAGAEEFKRCLPALEVFDVLGAGHMVVGDRNDAFMTGALQFLQRHMPAHGEKMLLDRTGA